MGNGSSSDIRSYYRNFAKTFKGTSGANATIYGAGEAEDNILILGGTAEEAKHYQSGLMSQAKKDLINRIAAEVSRVFGVKDVNPQGKSIEQVVTALRTKIPGYKNGQKFAEKAGALGSVCVKLAGIINQAFGYQLLNPKEDAGRLCSHIDETLEGLFTSIHAEFLGVRDGVSRAIKNINILDAALRKVYNVMMQRVGTADSAIKSKVLPLTATYEQLQVELTRQLTTLNSMMDNIVSPVDKELAEALGERADFRQLVQKLGIQDKDMASKAAFAAHGLTNVASAAAQVEKALKDLAIKTEEYKKLNTPAALKDMIDSKTADLMNGPDEAFYKFIEAQQILYAYEYLHPKIVEELSKKVGSCEEPIVDASSSAPVESSTLVDGSDEGDDDEVDSPISGGIKIDKKIKKRQQVRQQLFKTFTRSISSIIDDIVTVSKQIVVDIKSGKFEIKDDKLERFIRALDLVPSISGSYTFYSLIGYNTDAQSVQDRTVYISNVKNLIAACKELMGSAGSAALKEFVVGYERLLQLLDQYASLMNRDLALPAEKSTILRYEGSGEGPSSFGVEEGGDDVSADGVSEANTDSDNVEVEGGGKGSDIFKALGKGVSKIPQYMDKISSAMHTASTTVGNVGLLVSDTKRAFSETNGVRAPLVTGADEFEVTSVARVASNMSEIQNSIKYAFRTTKMLESLKSTSADHASINDDYIEMLADAIAGAIDLKVDEATAVVDPLNKAVTKVSTATKLHDGSVPVGTPAATPDIDASKRQAIEKSLRKRAEYFTQVSATAKEMYQTAENVDRYMQHFIDNLAADPMSAKSVAQSLSAAEIMSKWYDGSTGDDICAIFDSMPSHMSNTGPVSVSDLYNRMRDKYSNKHYYDRVAVCCGTVAATDSYTRLTGAAPTGAAVANPAENFREVTLKDGSASCIRWQNATGVRQALPENTKIPSKDTNRAGFGNFFPGNPYVPRPLTEEFEKSFNKYMNRAMEVGNLKNICNTFVNIGRVVNGKNLEAEAKISPGQIYKSLVRYMSRSAHTMGRASRVPGINVVTLDAKLVGTPPNVNNNMTYNRGVNIMHYADVESPLTVEPVTAVANDAGALEVYGDGITLRSVLKQVSGATGLFADPYVETDKLFVMVVKSIVAKILTVIGVYNMIDRPVDKNGLGYYAEMRLTLGGAVDAVPKIIPEALELYVRMPLLAELYRRIFKFDKEQDKSVISMVPEVDGVFAGLIRVIFDRARFVKTGTYSDTDIRMLIEEINKAYMAYSARNVKGKSICIAIIEGFVNDINKRYGVLKSADIKAFVADKESRYADKYRGPEDAYTSYKLEGIDEDDDLPTVNPSQAYQTKTVGSNVSFAHKYKLDIDENSRMLQGLRIELQNLFAAAEGSGDVNLDNTSKVSFEPLLKARREELKGAVSDDEKYAIVATTITSLGEFATPALEKTLLLFQEMVVAPLNNLGYLYRYLSTKYRIAKAAKKINDLLNPTTAGPAVMTGDLLNALRDLYMPAKIVAPALWPFGGTRVAPAPVGTAGNGDQLLDNHGHGIVACIYAYLDSLTMPDGLIVVRINSRSSETPGGAAAATAGNMSVQIDSSKLRKYVEDIMKTLHMNIDKFRGLVPKNFIDKYEKLTKDTDGSLNFGSLFYLEKYLQDRLINGKIAGTNDANDDNLADTDSFERSGEYVDSLLKTVLAKLKVTDGLTMERLLINAVAVGGAPMPGGENAALQYTINPVPTSVSGYRDQVPFISSGLFDRDSIGLAQNFNGIIARYNQIVAAYLNQVADRNVRKVYKTCLDKYAAGSASAAVMGGNTFNTSNAAPFVGGLPAYGSAAFKGVLSSALALAMANIINAKDKDRSVFYTSDLAEIPLFVKERMRANLPGLKTMANLLIDSAERAKPFIRATLPTDKAGAAPAATIVTYINVIDQVVNELKGLIETIDATLSEIGTGDAKFFETSENFIEKYTASNKIAPYMPPSIAASVLRVQSYAGVVIAAPPVGTADSGIGLPIFGSGTFANKFAYGTNALFNTADITMANIPGMSRLVKQHAEATEARFHFTDAEVERTIVPSLEILRFLHSRVNIIRYIGFINNTQNDYAFGNATTPLAKSYVLDTATQIGSIIGLTESNSQKERRRAVVDSMGVDGLGMGSRANRDTMIANNIVDLNICPINPNHLRREIPLINLHNATWTYDSAMADVLGMRVEDIAAMYDASTQQLIAHKINSGKDLMAALLVYPHANIDLKTYHNHFSRIARGALGIEGLGVPKFLSDQLYGKVLFGSVFGEEASMSDEADAAGSDAHMRATRVAFFPTILRTQGVDTLWRSRLDDGTLIAYVQDVYSKVLATGAAGRAVNPTNIMNVATGAYTAYVPLNPPSISADEIRYGANWVLSGNYQTTPYQDSPSTLASSRYRTVLAARIVAALIFSVHNRMPIILSNGYAPMMAGQIYDGVVFAINGSTRIALNGTNAAIDAYLDLLDDALAPADAALGPVAPARIVGAIPSPAAISNIDSLKIIELSKGYASPKVLNANAPMDLIHAIDDFQTPAWVKSGSLKYFDQKAGLVEVPVGQDIAKILFTLGKLRFDTMLVRNEIFVTLIQRMLRHKMRRDLTFYNQKVVKDLPVTASSITELYGRDINTDGEYKY